MAYHVHRLARLGPPMLISGNWYNPCFGLDFASVSEIRSQIMEQRNKGAAVLLISEDLDEILELSDRVAVMSEGSINYVAPISETDRTTIGKHMAGHD